MNILHCWKNYDFPLNPFLLFFVMFFVLFARYNLGYSPQELIYQMAANNMPITLLMIVINKLRSLATA